MSEHQDLPSFSWSRRDGHTMVFMDRASNPGVWLFILLLGVAALALLWAAWYAWAEGFPAYAVGAGVLALIVWIGIVGRLFRRDVLRLDAHGGDYRMEVGWRFAPRVVEGPLEELGAVLVRREWIEHRSMETMETRSDANWVAGLTLEGVPEEGRPLAGEGGPQIQIASGAEDDVFAVAETVCDLLRIPLVDGTEGPVEILRPEELDRHAGESPLEAPRVEVAEAPPEGSGIRMDEGAGELTLVVPPSGLRGWVGERGAGPAIGVIALGLGVGSALFGEEGPLFWGGLTGVGLALLAYFLYADFLPRVRELDLARPKERGGDTEKVWLRDRLTVAILEL